MGPKKSKKFKVKRFKGKEFKKISKETPDKSYKQNFYDANWRKYKYRFLHHNPNCYACGVSKKETTLHIDHIKAHKNNRDLFWKVDNYIPLCINCHSYVTSMFDRFDVQLLKEKLTWLAEIRKAKRVNTRVKIVPFKGENTN